MKHGQIVWLVGQCGEKDFVLVEAEVINDMGEEVSVNVRPGCSHKMIEVLHHLKIHETREAAEARKRELEGEGT